MNPIRSTELSLRFAGEWSSAWLLVALPVVVAVAAWLLRGQFPDVRRPRALALACLRVALVALVAVLAFRPDLVLTETLTWPGRVIVVVDNSASMGVPDPLLPAAAALRLARTLDPQLAPRADHDRSEALVAVADVIAGFEPVSRDGDRDDDAFWKEAERAEEEAARLLDEAGRPDLLPGIAAVFGGRSHAGGRAFAAAGETVRAAAIVVREAGDRRDAEAVAEAAPAAAGLAAALVHVRARPRIDLVKAVLEMLPRTLPEQRLEVVPLVEAAGGDDFALADGGTDMAGRLAGLVADPEQDATNAAPPADRSPINAILVVGDGRDTVTPALPPPQLLARLAERKAPVIACGVGGPAEPTDLAVLSLGVPPIAVAGEPLPLTARIKTASAPATATMRLGPAAAGAAALAAAEFAVGAAPEATVRVSFTPTATDPPSPPQRLAIEVTTVPGEVVPTANNRREFVLAVRPEPVRVLLLDAVPRWETRFAINTLGRLPFVELNAIVASTRPQGRLVRGVQRGTWPIDEATLALYSVAFLGRLPDEMLATAEREALDRWVREGGGTLVHLAPAGAGPVPPAEWQLFRTALGLAHPLTRGLPAPRLAEPDAPTARLSEPAAGGETPLVVTLDPAGGPPVPLITVARDGAGKRVTIASDELWRVLNPRNLDAHTAVFAELVAWAALAPPATAAPEADRPQAVAGEPISVALPATAPAEAEVEVVRDGETVATLPARGGVAVVPPQPAGTLHLRLAGAAALSQPVEIVADDPELKLLARDDRWLATLAARSGGRLAALEDLPRLVRSVPPKSHVERQERVWRPWNSGGSIAVLAGLLILEWVWRKWEGLV
jgi:hypothetical protein